MEPWLLGSHSFLLCFLWPLQAAMEHLPVSLLAGSPFALDLRAHGRPQEAQGAQAAGATEGIPCLLEHLVLQPLLFPLPWQK